MAEIRINATGGVKLYDADDSHYAQIIAGTITSNTDVMTLGHNVINIPMTTASSSATTGALTIGGGLGVAADLYVGDDTYLITDSAVLGFGADKDTTLTHTDGTGLTLNSTNKLCFNDASQFVQGSSATVLSIGATDEIDLTATAVDLNGTLDVSGTSLLTGRVGVVTAGDLGSGIHIRTADSGAGVEGDADELVIEGSGNTGMSILAGSSSQANIFFGDSSDADVGRIYYNNSGDTMSFFVNAGERLRSGSLGQISTGDESAADVSSGGLCLNQSSYDTNVLTFKSSDVAHGVTTIEETDTYFSHKKYDGGTGGNKIIGFDENDSPFVFHAIFATGNTYKTSQGNGPFRVMCADINGTGVAVAPANANLFTISKNISGSNCVFIVDEDGDIYYDGSAAAFDEHDDAQLVRAYDQYRAPDAVIQGKFDKFVQYNRQSLIDAKLIGDCPIEEEMAGTNKPLVSLTGMQRLHNGAIWQQYEKHQQLLEAVYDLAKEAVGEEKANAILDKHEVKRLQ